MRTVLPALALCLAAHAASAASPLQGQWRIAADSLPGYTGTVLIDAERRATWDAPVDRGRPAKFHGYVSGADGEVVEIILTDRVNVVRMHCSAQSDDLLDCYNAFADGSRSATFVLVRIGQGPAKLAPVLP